MGIEAQSWTADLVHTTLDEDEASLPRAALEPLRNSVRGPSARCSSRSSAVRWVGCRATALVVAQRPLTEMLEPNPTDPGVAKRSALPGSSEASLSMNFRATR